MATLSSGDRPTRSSEGVVWREHGHGEHGHGERGGSATSSASVDEPGVRAEPSRWRPFAAVATLLVVGAVIVTVADGDRSPPGPEATVDSTAGDQTPADESGPTISDGVDGSPAVDGRPGERTPVDAGLRYGGAGGGADIRAPGDDRTARLDIEPIDAPLVDVSDVPRLALGVDVVWEAIVDLDPALDVDAETGRAGELEPAEGDGATSVADPAVRPVVSLGVGDDVVVAAIDLGGRFVVVATDLSGEIRWRTTVAADSSVAVLGVIEGLVALGVDGRDAGSLRVLRTLDGSEMDDPERRGALIDHLGRRVATAEVDVGTIDPGSLLASPDADEITAEHVAQVAAGRVPIQAADEVADGRLVILAGVRLLGVSRVDDGLIVDWSEPGVMVGSSPSERGANLLVSDRRGAFLYVVDAASGRTVSEVSGLPSAVDVYTPLADGVVVKRPALVGSSLVGVGLDGRERWRLLGSPPFAVGDRLLVTASWTDDGLVLSARR